jgi:hypothetical protein
LKACYNNDIGFGNAHWNFMKQFYLFDDNQWNKVFFPFFMDTNDMKHFFGNEKTKYGQNHIKCKYLRSKHQLKICNIKTQTWWINNLKTCTWSSNIHIKILING